jgi:hypothetical protein
VCLALRRVAMVGCGDDDEWHGRQRRARSTL